MADSTPAPGTKPGSGKIILIVVAVLAVAASALAYIGWRVAHNASGKKAPLAAALSADSQPSSDDNDDARVNEIDEAQNRHRPKNWGQGDATPGAGSSPAKMNFTAAELGVDLYPGAEEEPGGGMRTRSESFASYTTSDPAGKVFEFYKSRLNSGAKIVQAANESMVDIERSNDAIVVVVHNAGDDPGARTNFIIQHSKWN